MGKKEKAKRKERKKEKINLKWKKKCPRIKQGSIGTGVGAVQEGALGFWKERQPGLGWAGGRGDL